MKSQIKVIAFDADDTIWHNEGFYQETEKKFCELLKDFASADDISKELLKIEIANIDLYGFGAKAFVLSLIETALKVSDNKVSTSVISEIISLGKKLIDQPVTNLGDVEPVLEKLKNFYTLVLATKGDLLDQERKLKKSGLEKYFDHIEVMSHKSEEDYLRLIHKMSIKNHEFLMIGNSVKSDILPVISIGAKAIHIPYHTTWEHEVSDCNENMRKEYLSLSKIKNLIVDSDRIEDLFHF